MSSTTAVIGDVNLSGPGFYFAQDWKLDKEHDIYERSVYTFSDVLQDVGGFYNPLFFFGLFIYSSFQESLMFSSLIGKLYQIEVQSKEVLRRMSTRKGASKVNPDSLQKQNLTKSFKEAKKEILNDL